jgi:hypothetical protein
MTIYFGIPMVFGILKISDLCHVIDGAMFVLFFSTPWFLFSRFIHFMLLIFHTQLYELVLSIYTIHLQYISTVYLRYSPSAV